MNSAKVVIEAGSVYAYRIFDCGTEIDLKAAGKMLEQKGPVRTYHLKKSSRSFLVSEHPLQLSLTPWSEVILDNSYEVQCHLKIWSFGSISMQLSIQLGRSFTLDELCELSYFFENNETFHKIAVKKVEYLMQHINSAIVNPGLWKEYEDYIIFKIERFSGAEDTDLREVFLNSTTTSLILGEKPMTFSEQFNLSLASNVFQYGDDDLVLIHWNGALIYDQDDADDIAYVIEFALCQLLELRYYDNLLDNQLNALYQRIEKQKHGLLVNPYVDLSREATLEYIDISEIVDKITNAFKVVGDYYYAIIYRAATDKLHIPDWRRNVDSKLKNLAEFCKLFQGDVNEKRNQLMEFTIIVLIAIEVIPFLYKLWENSSLN